jgi:hypothetical protein
MSRPGEFSGAFPQFILASTDTVAVLKTLCLVHFYIVSDLLFINHHIILRCVALATGSVVKETQIKSQNV